MCVVLYNGTFEMLSHTSACMGVAVGLIGSVYGLCCNPTQHAVSICTSMICFVSGAEPCCGVYSGTPHLIFPDEASAILYVYVSNP